MIYKLGEDIFMSRLCLKMSQGKLLAYNKTIINSAA